MTEQDFEKMEELTRKVTKFLAKQHRIYTDQSIYPSHVGLRLSFIRTFNGIGNAEALSDMLGFTERYHPSFRWFERLMPALNERDSKAAAGLQAEISKLARLKKNSPNTTRVN